MNQQFQDNGAGAYGRDGAPASNFMSSPPSAHRLPSPQRPNIAPSERPLPPSDRYSPRPSVGYRTPPIRAAENPFASPYDPKLSPPKAAFLEPASVCDSNSDSHSSYGLIHGENEKVFHRPVARLEDLKRSQHHQDSSMWLKKQATAGSKFKTATWVFATLCLIVIVGLLAKIISKPSPTVTSPTPLKWANGASSVPTFGVSPTSAIDQSQTRSSNTDTKTSNHPTITQQSKRRSLYLID